MVKTKDTKYRFHQDKKIMEKPSDQTILKVVTQRVTSGGLLIDAGKEEWIGFGRGLIFHVSFTKHCPIDKDFTSVCKSLLNSNLSTSGQWQQDHGDADSVLGLCKKGLSLYYLYLVYFDFELYFIHDLYDLNEIHTFFRFTPIHHPHPPSLARNKIGSG